MSITAMVVTGIWGMGWPIAARLAFRHVMDDGHRTHMQWEDRAAASFIGLFWPVALVLLAGCLVFIAPTARYTTRAQRAERERDALREARAERRRFEDRTAELEHEAGITGGTS